MGCDRGKEAVGLLEGLFGADGALIYVHASRDAMRDFVEGKKPFNKTFLRFVHKRYGPSVVSQYFRDYSREEVDPFVYLSHILSSTENNPDYEESSRHEHFCTA